LSPPGSMWANLELGRLIASKALGSGAILF